MNRKMLWRYRPYRFTADAGTRVIGGLVSLALAVLAWLVPPLA